MSSSTTSLLSSASSPSSSSLHLPPSTPPPPLPSILLNSNTNPPTGPTPVRTSSPLTCSPGSITSENLGGSPTGSSGPVPPGSPSYASPYVGDGPSYSYPSRPPAGQRRLSTPKIHFAPLPSVPSEFKRRNSITLGVASRRDLLSGGVPSNAGARPGAGANRGGSVQRVYMSDEDWEEYKSRFERNGPEPVELGQLAKQGAKALWRKVNRTRSSSQSSTSSIMSNASNASGTSSTSTSASGSNTNLNLGTNGELSSPAFKARQLGRQTPAPSIGVGATSDPASPRPQDSPSKIASLGTVEEEEPFESASPPSFGFADKDNVMRVDLGETHTRYPNWDGKNGSHLGLANGHGQHFHHHGNMLHLDDDDGDGEATPRRRPSPPPPPSSSSSSSSSSSHPYNQFQTSSSPRSSEDDDVRDRERGKRAAVLGFDEHRFRDLSIS